jgi:competence protein ComFC
MPFIPPVDTVTHFYKYRKMIILTKLIGRGMAQVIVSDFFLKKSDVIVPVPLFWWKKLKRGYNQAALLAEVVGDECRIEVKHSLRRVKNTKTQTKLNEESRKENVSNAFEVNDGMIKDKIVLLIDDVLTTGATLNECARVLKEAGAKKVYSCVAAIAPG